MRPPDFASDQVELTADEQRNVAKLSAAVEAKVDLLNGFLGTMIRPQIHTKLIKPIVTILEKSGLTDAEIGAVAMLVWAKIKKVGELQALLASSAEGVQAAADDCVRVVKEVPNLLGLKDKVLGVKYEPRVIGAVADRCWPKVKALKR